MFLEDSNNRYANGERNLWLNNWSIKMQAVAIGLDGENDRKENDRSENEVMESWKTMK